ncbi:hypothetical protein [Siphonobacter sp. SORGH_AS_0500]|uniref:hypothetical protein n=1 Tax=Siphonobacter sp. SORGH_AS_0500 TaxID=1864824 RepID=UPI002861183E|nr:hypothetical protein [Siphonobacter sp. SORGH_AS_0500]MDR6194781.1 Fe2+ transport system protein B [Siphonobacter sp. SORGH_AS_0500]
MKNVSKIAAFLVVWVIGRGIGSAQDFAKLKNKSPEEKAQWQTEWMKKELNLSEKQISQVQVINLKYALENDSMLKNEGSKIAKLRQWKTKQKEKEKELGKVFSKEQFKQYQAIQSEIKEELRSRNQLKKTY